ncbi:cache domain-containing protein [Campylobacter geochelonis]|uniref:cache domain-containing protein n=1 Tax=Campylobacter geochelonis TaxID=1780362 RepID=UPI00155DB8D3|nr:cache domain-containing protein [Campylobacter geochelonis]
MSKLFKILSLFIFVCFVVIAGFYLHYLQNQKEQNIKKYFDFNSELMSKSLENERANSLAIAILLSKNSNIISCYQKQNHEYCMDVAKDFVGILSQVPSYKNINIHMHNAQTQSLARSWDENKFGDNLSGFRYMLNDIKRNMQPVAGIEVGRCGYL